jgi:hypothetical protein
MPPYFCAKIARVSGAISSRSVFVPTGHRIPAQSNALGYMPRTWPRSEGTPPCPRMAGVSPITPDAAFLQNA